MQEAITFWDDPTPRRYERLVRENVVHVGKVEGFRAIEDFIFTYAGGYTTLSHDNIDVLLSVQDNKLMIIEWSRHRNENRTFNKENKTVVDLDNYPLLLELAQHLEQKFRPSHYPTHNTKG